MSREIVVGNWLYSREQQQHGLVVGKQTLWGETVVQVWFPTLNTMLLFRPEQLSPLEENEEGNADKLLYAIAAARVSDTLTQHVLLAPMEASVVPLPHQLRALARATAGEQIRYLLADEVGLGKTIEAGLIIRELKLRGLARRILVLAPKGLVTQWVAEMATHFGETFQLVLPADFAPLHDSGQPENRWLHYDQVVCPMDAVKPLDKRRGWSTEQIAAYNYARFESLVTANWDLVIVDEAHRLSGSTDQVARYKLGQSLAETSPYLLLLSATPHQGKSDAFRRLLALLDPIAFPDISSVQKEQVQPYLIRTEKRHAIDGQGRPLFQPRQTRLIPILWREHDTQQRQLYEAVTEYARAGYNQAIKERKNYIGFLMVLMQRLVTSSTRAIQATLARRLELLQSNEEQIATLPLWSEEEWTEMDGQEQIETVLLTQMSALKNEQAEVERLVAIASSAMQAGPDVKTEALLEWIYRLQQEEADPALKILVFTEFVPTQEMLQQFLQERGFSVTTLNGSMSMEERRNAQNAFATSTQILISTDAGGEGLNLQFAHIIINYDIPWNPMRLEQRIGRIDRIGQQHPVRALNFALEDTVEYHVREVLESKLERILKEFGVDKASDVLDSVQTGQLFDDLFRDTILHKDDVQQRVATLVQQVQEQVSAIRTSEHVLQSEEPPDYSEAQQVMEHPLAHWIERMVITYLQGHGGNARQQRQLWQLTWPDGSSIKQAVFSMKDAQNHPSALHLTLEDERIRRLVSQLPFAIAGQPIPQIILSNLPSGVNGVWSLWQISLSAGDWHKQRIVPHFLHNDGRTLQPTARYLWDKLLTESIMLEQPIAGRDASELFQRVWQAIEQQNQATYTELRTAHQDYLDREQQRGTKTFATRKRAIARIGLASVRASRQAQLEQEEQRWRTQLHHNAQAHPAMRPLLLVHIVRETTMT